MSYVQAYSHAFPVLVGTQWPAAHDSIYCLLVGLIDFILFLEGTAGAFKIYQDIEV